MGQQGLKAIRLYPKYGRNKPKRVKPEDTKIVFIKGRTLQPQQTKPINKERGRMNIPENKHTIEDLKTLYHSLPLQVLITSKKP
jgi:hypothetical protein